MTYRCGIGPGMETLGFEPGEPHITCDRCGVTKLARTRTGMAPAWLLDGKAPPGWRMAKVGEFDLRRDWCQQCVEHAEFSVGKRGRR